MRLVGIALALAWLSGCAHSTALKERRDTTAVTAPLPPASDPHPELVAALPNFRVIEPGAVYRGGRPPPLGVEALAKAGVHTIIDLQGGDLENVMLRKVVEYAEKGETAEAIAAERKAAEDHGVRFVHLPLNSLHRLTPSEVTEVMQALATMHDPAAQPVYVHCEHGKDRTGMVSALYRVAYDGWTPQAAHDEMVAAGHSGLLDHLATGAMDQDFDEIAAVLAASRQPSAVSVSDR